MNQPEPSGADRTSAPIDLSGVAPLRRAETRRRIEVIRAYLAMAAPDAADRAAAAAELGIGVQQFMSLVRAWTVHGEAVAIAKAGAKAGAARAVRRRGLPPASRVAAEEALRALPVSATHRDAIAKVKDACRRRRTRPPSDSMVSYLRLNMHRADGAGGGLEGLLVGRATAALPILEDGVLSLPEVALAVDGRSGTIVAAAIVDSATNRPPASFATAVRKFAAGTAGPIAVGTDDEAVVGAMPSGRAVSRFSAGRSLARAIGRAIGGVRLTYGPLASTDPRRALRAKADEPLDPDEAAAVLDAAVATHNASRAGVAIGGDTAAQS